MSERETPRIDAAAVAALLRTADAPVAPERHAALVAGAAYVAAATKQLAAAGVDRLSPLAALWAGKRGADG